MRKLLKTINGSCLIQSNDELWVFPEHEVCPEDLSTLSPEDWTCDAQVQILPENKITEELKILEPTKQNDLEKKILEEAESRLENKKNRLIREEQELLEKKRIVKEEKEKAIQEQKEKEKEIQDKYKIIKEAKDDIIASSRQYLEEKLKASSEENKNYARRILELGGGGGSVAVQYANGGTMNGDLIVNGVVNATGGNSNQWNSTYSTVKSLSDSWEESVFITPLQAASASWNSVYSTTNSNSAKWESNYSSFSSNSASYDSVYSTVKSLSDSWEESIYITPLQAASGSWNSVYTSVKDNSAYWNDVYSQYSSNSASYATINFSNNKFLPLSGGKLTGLVTSTTSISSLSTIIANDFSTYRRVQYLSGSAVRVYQFYNSLTDSLDTIFN